MLGQGHLVSFPMPDDHPESVLGEGPVAQAQPRHSPLVRVSATVSERKL